MEYEPFDIIACTRMMKYIGGKGTMRSTFLERGGDACRAGLAIFGLASVENIDIYMRYFCLSSLFILRYLQYIQYLT